MCIHNDGRKKVCIYLYPSQEDLLESRLKGIKEKGKMKRRRLSSSKRSKTDCIHLNEMYLSNIFCDVKGQVHQVTHLIFLSGFLFEMFQKILPFKNLQSYFGLHRGFFFFALFVC